ncbi:hypothetical protein [Phycicoccus sp. Soil802]|uniref:hypothetical protein n=1 Tax=Phycicoccus sp. Soil802 TaxID=1736414 RepID=UPI00070312BA|nr:hypothetical protein [Phycicoccus sp. Soil802]KRF27470.1 hypothetical protein ASG91_13640 [Phycicoccus sp. Soil802]
MTTTESRSTPPTTWSGVDVLHLTDGGEAVVTLWTIPIPASAPVTSETLLEVAAIHAAALEEAGDWQPHDLSEQPDGVGGTYFTRELTSTGDGSSAAMGAYFPSQGGIAVATAVDPGGDDLAALFAELVGANRPRFLLTAEDVLALAEATGLAAPPVSPTAYPPDAPEEVRQAAHLAARGSLLARGLLVADGDRLAPVADLRAALALLLDGDRLLLVSQLGTEGVHSTALLGGRGGAVATLRPGAPGLLELSTDGASRTASRYAAWLTPRDGADSKGLAPCTVSLADLRTCVGSETGAAPLRGARSMVSVRGLRRRGDDAATYEANWVEDATGRLWSISATDDLEKADLAPADPDAIGQSLARALDFSAP